MTKQSVMERSEDNSQKEEWGGWKIVSDMLDKPNVIGIYPTSECYQRLYEFVCEQKRKALTNQATEIGKEVEKLHTLTNVIDRVVWVRKNKVTSIINKYKEE